MAVPPPSAESRPIASFRANQSASQILWAFPRKRRAHGVLTCLYLVRRPLKLQLVGHNTRQLRVLREFTALRTLRPVPRRLVRSTRSIPLADRHCGVTLYLRCKADDQACEQSHELIAPPSRRVRSPRAQPKAKYTKSDIGDASVSRRSLKESHQSRDGNDQKRRAMACSDSPCRQRSHINALSASVY